MTLFFIKMLAYQCVLHFKLTLIAIIFVLTVNAVKLSITDPIATDTLTDPIPQSTDYL